MEHQEVRFVGAGSRETMVTRTGGPPSAPRRCRCLPPLGATHHRPDGDESWVTATPMGVARRSRPLPGLPETIIAAGNVIRAGNAGTRGVNGRELVRGTYGRGFATDDHSEERSASK